MVRRRERGFTLMEVVISLALFGVFLFIIGQLTSEMRYYEKRYPVNFMAHPQVNAVIARLRKDVYDSTEYPETYETYTMGKQTLILETLQETLQGMRILKAFNLEDAMSARFNSRVAELENEVFPAASDT